MASGDPVESFPDAGPGRAAGRAYVTPTFPPRPDLCLFTVRSPRGRRHSDAVPETGDLQTPEPPELRTSGTPNLRNRSAGRRAPGAGRSSSRRATSARTVRRGLPAQSGTRHIPGVDKSSEEPSHAWFSTDRRHRISASMKSSSSPSRTPLVFEVSVSVRRSFTIWYGWRT